jgi:diguanylate cyclase (GGDEF)-like protein/PAS domain S-box-containing protein
MDRTTELKAQIAYLSAAVDTSEDAALSLDPSGSVTRWNRAALRLFGHTEGRMQGASLAELVAEDDRAAWQLALARSLAGGPVERLELSIRHRNGSLVPARVTAMAIRDDGGVLGVSVVVRDVGEQLISQATLAENARRVAESEALSHVGSWAWDAESDAVQWSEELHRIHGVGPQEFAGTLTAHLTPVHPADRADVANALRVALHNGSPLDKEYRVVRADGSIRWVYARAALVADGAGEGLGLRGIYQDITERHENAQVLQEANERLTQIALYDRLTGLPNRSLLVDQLRIGLARALRSGVRVDVLYLDVDDFKTINDSRGHHQGDEVLAALASRLVEAVRASDTVALAAPSTLARLHGDEFAIVLDNCGDPEVVVGRIEELLRSPLQLTNGEVFISVSIGIASAAHPTSEDSPEAMLAAANLAMHEAKRLGKGGHVLFEPRMHDAARDRHELGDELHRAIAENEFELAYQPVVALRDRRIIGAEALVRWHHPRRGVVPPDVFISRAEETGLILPLGKWVLNEACRQGARWATGDLADFTIAVNVSGRQLREDSFVGMVRNALFEHGLPPQNLCLEMTESILMERDDEAIAMLTTLRDEGVHLAIDDFGTGYSSLGSLRRLPVDLLKIDRSFVASLPEDDDAGTIAWAVVRLGHTLGMPVLAEGVETTEQHEALRRFGCDQAQGYLFGRPMSAQALSVLLRAQGVDTSTVGFGER